MNNTEVTKTKLSIPEGRGMAQKIYEYLSECNIARSCGGKIKEYKSLGGNTVVRLMFNKYLDVEYYGTTLFQWDLETAEVKVIMHSAYLTHSTMERYPAASKLIAFDVGFRIIKGEPYLIGNGNKIKLPLDKPFNLMKWADKLF